MEHALWNIPEYFRRDKVNQSESLKIVQHGQNDHFSEKKEF